MNDNLYNKTFSFKDVDLVKKNNCATKSFIMSVIVVELGRFATRYLLMFGRNP